MCKIICLCLVLLAFYSFNLAQQKCPEIEGNPHFPDFINASFSTEKYRLDQAAKALKMYPQKNIVLLIYGKRFGRNSKAIKKFRMSENYLIKKHQIEKERIIFVEGGKFQGGKYDWVVMKIFVYDPNLKDQPCIEQM